MTRIFTIAVVLLAGLGCTSATRSAPPRPAELAAVSRGPDAVGSADPSGRTQPESATARPGRVAVRPDRTPRRFEATFTFDRGPEGFVLVNGQPRSSITVMDGRLKIVQDRTDPANQLLMFELPFELTPASSFSVGSRFRVTVQGNHQIFFPLLLTSAGATGIGANVLWCQYASRDANMGADPEFNVQFFDRHGVQRMFGAVHTPLDAEYACTLSYDAGTVRGTIASPADRVLEDDTYALGGGDDALLGASRDFLFGAVAVATRGQGPNAGSEKNAVAWVDDITISAREF